MNFGLSNFRISDWEPRTDNERILIDSFPINLKSHSAIANAQCLHCLYSLPLRIAPKRSSRQNVPRIGYLSSTNPARESDPIRGISAGSARAWLHRRTRTSSSSIDMRRESKIGCSELAAELVRLKVDVIVVAGGTRRVRAAKNATKTIPIVMVAGGADPVEAG